MKNKKQTVLIVDDIPENIDVLEGILNDTYNIKAAINGKVALKIARSDNPPDIILLDIMMPEMDGFEVCKLLKEDIHTKKIPVIFVSARNEVVDEYRGFQIGGVDYISKPVSPPIVKARVRSQLAIHYQSRELEHQIDDRTKELEETRLEVIRRLGRAAEYKDNETGMHVIRMSNYSKNLALAYGLSEKEARLVLNAAPMHDIGKIGIADNILLKPGKLTEEEWETMREHPIIGDKIIGDHSSDLLRMAKTAAISHHEKWDGSGYPAGLKGKDIPLLGRIVAIADVFDALCSERPYKKAWPVEEALKYIKDNSGSHFDPELVSSFVKVFPEIVNIKNKYGDQ